MALLQLSLFVPLPLPAPGSAPVTGAYLTSTQKNLEISTRVGTIAHRQKVLKQAGVVHDIKSQ